jgi:hypothetical protein
LSSLNFYLAEVEYETSGDKYVFKQNGIKIAPDETDKNLIEEETGRFTIYRTFSFTESISEE